MFRKNILITGASSGLGEGMARAFAAKGSNLALCARRVENLEAIKADIEKAHPNVTVLIKALDVCDYDQVFTVFREFREELGSLDRVIVNAGMGKGASMGTGYFHANRRTAETNFIGAIAQCEAAMEIFREQNAGHLVTISSMSALRGLPRAVNIYAATKAGLRTLSEGLRADVLGTPIKVSCILPGFILTPINEEMKKAPLRVDLETGCRALVKAIEKEPGEAKVPAWPWVPVGWAMKLLPLRLVAKMT
ncbi:MULTISPECIES: SDR family oxidoreductase [Spongiibacter]|uniref:SDR family oxidoreductase n=1 Tax=Spongiibacter TaxID=630749 RepID=UPI0003B589B7|nr:MULTISPECIES: SDR family oxidoreductase [Spongiibacter]MAY39201.1 short-chain dehydrogenase [Spongiibacter sp.]MBI57528.1 short-chain dehydrogenase [Spongiibacter sp.]|tara:strand:- start:336 stop:1085 length:750 start_codon:yes stop_codon:yes gene_type:complete